MAEAETGPDLDPAFCHVVRREAAGSRYFLVHSGSPRVVVEMESGKHGHDLPRTGVIRRVLVPNSWAGEYHQSARLLGAAIAAYESPPVPRNDRGC